MGVVITDGKSSEPQRTANAAREAQRENIEMIAIGTVYAIRSDMMIVSSKISQHLCKFKVKL